MEKTNTPTTGELLDDYQRVAPLARAVIRSRELEIILREPPDGPVIDLGHGDGLFAGFLEKHGLEVAVGIDRSFDDLTRARGRSGARLVVCDMERLPFRPGVFGGAISNCVLEHVGDLDAALAEAARVTRPGGRFLATVVTDRYEPLLFWPRLFGRIGLRGLARWYLRQIKERFVHRRYFAWREWRAIGGPQGWRVVALRPYAGVRRQATMDLLLPFILFNKYLRLLTGREVIVPKRWPARRIAAWLDADPTDHAEDYAANLMLILEREAARTRR